MKTEDINSTQTQTVRGYSKPTNNKSDSSKMDLFPVSVFTRPSDLRPVLVGHMVCCVVACQACWVACRKKTKNRLVGCSWLGGRASLRSFAAGEITLPLNIFMKCAAVAQRCLNKENCWTNCLIHALNFSTWVRKSQSRFLVGGRSARTPLDS